jgi:hypothetical protein
LSLLLNLLYLTRENKSGSGRKELTERDKWIKEKFGFLGPYIARIQTRAGVNVNIFFSMFPCCKSSPIFNSKLCGFSFPFGIIEVRARHVKRTDEETVGHWYIIIRPVLKTAV